MDRAAGPGPQSRIFDPSCWGLSTSFGDVQAEIYSETLSAAVQALIAGPSQPEIKARPEIGRDLFTLHGARNGVLFRVDAVLPMDRSTFCAFSTTQWIARHVPEGE